jgi:NAD(P)-dependent dehydrogenase (short-subunit alcohol dehydrogenase family)
MTNQQGRVAVVTGAAGGIGRGLAERFADEGMSVVMADVEEGALERAAAAMRARGVDVLDVRVDVARAEDVRALASRAFERFGRVDVLCANAGVTATEGRIWETTERELEWVVGVNLFGVVHTIREFVPKMLVQGSPGHVVVTASNAGLHSGPGLNIYAGTKSAVIRIAEGLHYELRQIQADIAVSILVPGSVQTGIVDAERNRPSELLDELGTEEVQIREARRAAWRRDYAGPRTITPEAVADQVWQALADKQFYILTHPSIKENLRKRTDDLIEERTPVEMPLYPTG